MQLQCGQCGESFTAPALPAGTKLACPACGAAITIPRTTAGSVASGQPSPSPHPHPHHEHGGGVDRIFEPFPRPVLYLFGLILVLGLLAPFWLTWVGGLFDRPAPVVDHDLDSLPAASALTNSLIGAATGLLDQIDEATGSSLSEYGSIRLETHWDELSRRYPLQLTNTRGMTPEIYDSTHVPGVEQATFYFYERLLKEFVLVYAEQRMVPLRIVRTLQAQLGEPTDWSDDAPGFHGIESGLAERLAQGDLPKAPGSAQPKTYPYRQRLTWFDGEYRLSATIDFSSKEPVDCRSRLTIHVSATAWLDPQQPDLATDTGPAPERGTVLADDDDLLTIPPPFQERKQQLFP